MASSRSVFPISVNGITRWTDRDGRFYLCGTRDDPSRVGLNHRLLIQGNKMSNLSFFIALAGLLLFPDPTPAETKPITASCARPGLQALREAQEEMTVRDTAAATGIKESTLRQLLKGLPKEGRMCGEEEEILRAFATTSSGHSRLKLRQTALTLSRTRLTISWLIRMRSPTD